MVRTIREYSWNYCNSYINVLKEFSEKFHTLYEKDLKHLDKSN